MTNILNRIEALEQQRQRLNPAPRYTSMDLSDAPGSPAPGVIYDPAKARPLFDFSQCTDDASAGIEAF